MGTTFLVTFTLFLFFETYSASSNTSLNVTCIQTERDSLLVFRQGLTDESNRLSTWTGVECCEWEGVGCDRRNGHVVKLDLRNPIPFTSSSSYLRGEVSASLLNLKHLRYLDMSMNSFSGNIPEFFGSFMHLEFLDLSHSGFGGEIPHQLGNLSRLQYLYLNSDILDLFDHGVYFDFGESLLVKDDLRWLSSLSSLKHLDLSGIFLGDSIDWFHPVNMLPSLLTLNLAHCDIIIPSIKFINFTSLKSLDLSSNGIHSTIPVWLSNLTGLMHLNLQGNYFHGGIPRNLSSLVSINLSSNRLNTSMSDLFWNLSSLVHLDLSDNAFYGSFTTDVKLCNLSVLILSSNKFSGDLLSFIGNMSSDCLHNSLKDLNLELNYFNGRIPNEIGEFKKLEHLLLSFNNLSGPIPPSLGHLSMLERLDLSSNELSGNIPTSLGQLSNLGFLDVSNNSLTGVLSEIHFTELKKLTILWLSHNSFTLNVSSRWIPPFQLHQFRADSCNIGPRFPNWLQTQENLLTLSLSNSSIKDTIPEWFENISSHISEMDLSLNQISGKLPRFHVYTTSHISEMDLSLNQISAKLPRLQVLTPLQGRRLILNSNKFEGSLTSFPSNVYVLDLSDNLLSGNVPYTNGTMNPDLSIVNLGKNRFTGSIPTHLCELLSINLLDLSHNNFSGILPECLGSLIQLRVMDLTNNTITGDVPNSLGSLSYLESLHLHNNNIEGNLPLSLQNLTSLVTMDLGNNLLTGNIPFWIGKKLSKLKILNLQSNKFTGKIPLELCQINALQHLNLADNSITGNVPRCFCNLTGMITSDVNFRYDDIGYEENINAYIKGIQLKYTKTIGFLISLDLSNNKIIGEIPDVLMNLASLMNLNLSRNLLSGHIPTRIGNLKSMESLDLSTNKLSGRIPPSLGSLNFLSYLNLSFNKLSGPIPVGNQLQTFNDPTMYEGNNGLCGYPLLRSCYGNNHSRVGDDEGKDGSQGLSWFNAGMVSGFSVGFIGLIGSLHFIRIWRVTYFQMIENVYTWLTVSILVTLARLRRKFF